MTSFQNNARDDRYPRPRGGPPPRQQFGPVASKEDADGCLRREIQRLFDPYRSYGKNDDSQALADIITLLPRDAVARDEVIEKARGVNEGRRIVDDMSTFLSDAHWDLYAHLTFPNPVSQPLADKQFRAWVLSLNRKNYGHNFYKRDEGAWWVRSTELQDRGVPHFHAVIGGLSLDPALCADKWRGNAKVESYDPNRAGMAYVLKEARRGSLQLAFSDNLKTALSSTHRQT